MPDSVFENRSSVTARHPLFYSQAGDLQLASDPAFWNNEPEAPTRHQFDVNRLHPASKSCDSQKTRLGAAPSHLRMFEKIRRVDNPLTIIAVFAGITEIAASSALPFLKPDVQSTFVWFLIVFPFALIAAFFLTLNFNTKVLYAPADYRDDKHFLQALEISSRALEIRVSESDGKTPIIEQLSAPSVTGDTLSPFDGITKAELRTANAFFTAFQKFGTRLFKAELISGYGFGVHGDGLFLLTTELKGAAEHSPGRPQESRIIRSKEQPDGSVVLSVVGRPLKSTDPDEFAKIVGESIEGVAKKFKEDEMAERNHAGQRTPAAMIPQAQPSPKAPRSGRSKRAHG